MAFFYNIQKMQQLDLFGMPIEPVSAPAKKTIAPKAKPVQEQMPEPEHRPPWLRPATFRWYA